MIFRLLKLSNYTFVYIGASNSTVGFSDILDLIVGFLIRITWLFGGIFLLFLELGKFAHAHNF